MDQFFKTPYAVKATPEMLKDWTGPSVTPYAYGPTITMVDCGIVWSIQGEEEAIALSHEYPKYLATLRAEVRDRLARVFPRFRWITEQENSGRLPKWVAAALWWSAAQGKMRMAYGPWKITKGKDACDRRGVRLPLRPGDTSNGLHVAAFWSGSAWQDAKQCVDDGLLHDGFAVWNGDHIVLPMPWGIVTLKQEPQ